MPLLEVTEDDLVVRTVANEAVATTFCALDRLEDALRLRLDSGVWEAAPAADRIKAAIQAYHELADLPWLRYDWRRSNQRRDAGSLLFDEERPMPPVEDELFQQRIPRAQTVQALHLLQGTEIRLLQRDGVRLTRQLQGSEMEIAGYKGPVCVEALEILAPFLDLSLRVRTFR
jgi:hypothetical protein